MPKKGQYSTCIDVLRAETLPDIVMNMPGLEWKIAKDKIIFNNGAFYFDLEEICQMLFSLIDLEDSREVAVQLFSFIIQADVEEHLKLKKDGF